VLSEIVRAPGPTNSLFDVLAAAIAALTPGSRAALLGFAGGGLVAPLRAMGFAHPLDAVDLSLEGERVFRRHAGPWAGRIRVDREDALRWLRRSRKCYDLILEDLSIEIAGDVTKPGASFAEVPGMVARRLAPQGVAVTNLLPVPGMPWGEEVRRASRPWPNALLVHLDEYENRVLIASRARLDARTVSRDLRRHLRALGSNQAERLHVRTARAGRRRRTA
jgi:spermidine synthase